jgi:hypothetical protein
MSTIAADLQSLNRGVNSRTTISRTGIASANIGRIFCNIHQGSKINVYHPEVTAIVIRPFVVEITPTEEEYLATSHISKAYELGVTPGIAVKNYLEFLVDELIWLQKHEENLSPSIHEDLRFLQNYIRIV